MKVRYAALAAALALVIPPTGTLGTPASASPLNLSAELISIGQMPTGWITYGSLGAPPGCLANAFEPTGIKQTASAAVNFAASANGPLLQEKLTTYTNARTAFQKIIANLTACHQLSGISGGYKETGTVERITNFPHYGDASEAFAVSLTAQGTTNGEDVLAILKGSIVMVIGEADLVMTSGDVNQLQGFVELALSDLAPATVGSTISFEDPYGTPYTVKLDQFIDPSCPGQGPPGQERFVGAIFTVTNQSALSRVSFNPSLAYVLGPGVAPSADPAADAHAYPVLKFFVNECENFNFISGGSLPVGGPPLTGGEIFELPLHASVAAIEWIAGSGHFAVWHLEP
jgi:hypothetical protein